MVSTRSATLNGAVRASSRKLPRTGATRCGRLQGASVLPHQLVHRQAMTGRSIEAKAARLAGRPTLQPLARRLHLQLYILDERPSARYETSVRFCGVRHDERVYRRDCEPWLSGQARCDARILRGLEQRVCGANDDEDDGGDDDDGKAEQQSATCTSRSKTHTRGRGSSRARWGPGRTDGIQSGELVGEVV